MTELCDPITHLHCYFSWLNFMHVLCITVVNACIQQLAMSSKFCFTEDIHYFWFRIFLLFFQVTVTQYLLEQLQRMKGLLLAHCFVRLNPQLLGPSMLELKPKVEGIRVKESVLVPPNQELESKTGKSHRKHNSKELSQLLLARFHLLKCVQYLNIRSQACSNKS